MTYRILERNDGKCYVEEKGLFFWKKVQEQAKDIWDEYYIKDRVFNDLEHAKHWIQDNEKLKEAPKIKKTYNINIEEIK